MRPKHLLWIAFGAIFSAWSSLDPAARPVGDALAEALRIGINHIAHQPAQQSGQGTAIQRCDPPRGGRGPGRPVAHPTSTRLEPKRHRPPISPPASLPTAHVPTPPAALAA
jgi:hypothetical protein